MPGPPAVSCPPGGEATVLVTELVDELARRLGAGAGHRPVDADGSVEARRAALVRLRILADVKEVVRRLEDESAHAAAADGAGYPEIGQALGMSRQGARRRWPGLITHSTQPAPSPPTPRSS
jgi:hypothetical protein